MRPPPFVVFSLPRSRSAWLALWLSRAAGRMFGHDLAITSDTVDAWLSAIVDAGGTAETGSVELWPVLRRSIPDARILVVRRDIEEIGASLGGLGFDVPWPDLHRRQAALYALAQQPGIMTVDFPHLANPRCCAAIQAHCLGQPFNWPLWEEMDRTNTQVRMPERKALLAERAPAIAVLKIEMADRLAVHKPFVLIHEEPWAWCRDEFEAMARGHHDEASNGLGGVYALNMPVLAEMAEAGLWRTFIARVDGAMAGYCTWTIERNLEAVAPLTWVHGPFYSAPEHKGLHLGRRLLDVSRSAAEAEGVKLLRLHHTTHGRGCRAGSLYERMGAVEFQREYILRIGCDA